MGIHIVLQRSFIVAALGMAFHAYAGEEFQNDSLPSAVAASQIAESATKPVKEHSLNAVTAELEKELEVELTSLGYSQVNMAQEADSIHAIKDLEAKAKKSHEFLDKYKAIALTAMKRLADRASSETAMQLILDAEKILQFRPYANSPLPENLPLPEDIFLMYQRIGEEVATLDETPCLDWATRVSCALAGLVDQECSYVSSSWQELAQNGIESHAGSSHYLNTYANAPQGRQRVNYVDEGSSVNPRFDGSSLIGITLHLLRRQNSMCVSFKLPNNTHYHWGLEGLYDANSTIFAKVGRVQRASVHDVNNVQSLRVPNDNTGIGCGQSIELPIRSSRGHEAIYDGLSQRPCWYKNLKQAYDAANNSPIAHRYRYSQPFIERGYYRVDRSALGLRVEEVLFMNTDTLSGINSSGSIYNRAFGGIMVQYDGIEILTIRDR